MRFHRLLILATALFAGACGERAAEEPAPVAEPAVEAPAPAPVAEPAAEAEAPRAEVDEAFIAHMHAHAEKLDDINFALDDDNLEAARVPAYWLSRHDTIRGIPTNWQGYVSNMREAAGAVEAAADLATARAAAERISDNCRGCHTEAGIAYQ